MPEVSLTTFVDFVAKAGTPKLTVVRNCKNKGAYDPKTDFYKPIREEIVRMHSTGLTVAALSALLRRLTDDKKKTAYPDIVKGYRKFIGTKKVTWFRPPHDQWSHGGLNVVVNPELGSWVGSVNL